MAATAFDRRTFVVAGGAAVAGAGFYALAGRRDAPAETRPPAHPGPIAAAVPERMRGILAVFGNPATDALRKTSGGGADMGRVIPDSGTRSIWEAMSLLGVLYDLADTFGDAAARARFEATYAAILAEFGAETLSGGPAAFGGGRPIYTMDDGVWVGLLLQKHHALTGDPVALGCLAELIAALAARFADPDTVHNPLVTYAARTPNTGNIDYGRGRDADGRFIGPPFVASVHGMLYTTADKPNYKQYGKVATTFEPMLALLALHVGDHLGQPGYIAYARHVEREFRVLRTPDPAAAAAKFGAAPASRSAKGLLFVQRCLAVTGGTPNDPKASFLGPDVEYYGKPVQGIDATSLGGSAAMALLQARLYKRTGDPALRAMAVETANALIDLQAYGRDLGGVRSLADTRDPHSDGMWLVPFGREVLTLDGVAQATRDAMEATAARIVRTCVVGGLLNADWVGPELNPVDGLTTWQQNYDAHPGAQAGYQQIMTNATSMGMILLGAMIEGWRTSGLPKP